MAAFSTFTFAAGEEPVSDSGWSMPKGSISADYSLPLGAAQESIVTIGGGQGFGGVGSRRRTIEMYLTRARFALLEALLNTEDALTDWESTPVSYAAIMTGCESVDNITGDYGLSTALRRVRLEFVQIFA